MKKADAVKAHLVAALPIFRTNPDQLKVWVDDGRIVSRRTPALGFEYRYQLQILAEAVSIGPDDLLIPLLLWLREHQPDLLLRFQEDASALRFAADILDEDRWNIAVILDLTEAVTLVARPDGSGWDVEHLPEPSPDDPLLPGASQDQSLATLFAADRQVLP